LAKVKIKDVCIFSAREFKFSVLFQRAIKNWSVCIYFTSTVFFCFAETISYTGG
jgi:hypothetical protein